MISVWWLVPAAIVGFVVGTVAASMAAAAAIRQWVEEVETSLGVHRPEVTD